MRLFSSHILLCSRCFRLSPLINFPSLQILIPPILVTDHSNLPRNLSCSLWPLGFPFVPQSSVDKVRLQDQQGQVPHEGDGVEEIGVAAAGVQPQVVESWAEQGGV